MELGRGLGMSAEDGSTGLEPAGFVGILLAGSSDFEWEQRLGHFVRVGSY